MLERREFLKGSAVAVSALALGAGANAFASEGASYTGIIYTKDNPGKWDIPAHLEALELDIDLAYLTIPDSPSVVHTLDRAFLQPLLELGPRDEADELGLDQAVAEHLEGGNAGDAERLAEVRMVLDVRLGQCPTPLALRFQRLQNR